MLLDKFPFSKVVAISGSGQQHGSVYWKNGAQSVMKNLTPHIPLASQLDVSSHGWCVCMCGGGVGGGGGGG